MTALTHAQAHQWIEQAADGLLDAAKLQILADHLNGCADCRAFAAELAALESEIGRTLKAHWGQPTLPKSGEQNLVKQLQDQFGSGKSPVGSPPFFLIGLLLMLLAIAFWYFANAGAFTPEATATVTNTATLVPSATLPGAAVATKSPTPVELVLTAVPTQNTNCREGNGSQFEIADTLIEGTKYTPIGRGRDNMWVLFNGPTFGTKCWAYIQNLTLLINDDPVAIEDVSAGLLPFVSYPPTPTPAPTPTFTPEPFTPQCNDGVDNDGDRRIDLNDTSCRNANDNDESN